MARFLFGQKLHPGFQAVQGQRVHLLFPQFADSVGRWSSCTISWGKVAVFACSICLMIMDIDLSLPAERMVGALRKSERE